jgi:hypothetical protein
MSLGLNHPTMADFLSNNQTHSAETPQETLFATRTVLWFARRQYLLCRNNHKLFPLLMLLSNVGKRGLRESLVTSTALLSKSTP